jgi:Ca2+-binding EF-hand superfamily protein
LESRIGPDALKKGLAEDYPNGYDIEVGKGSPGVGTIYLRATSLKDKYGLDWTLVIGLGKRSFFTKFERLSNVMTIISLGVIAFTVAIASMLSKWRFRKIYLKDGGQRKKSGIEPPTIGEEDTLHKKLNPDSQEFFDHFKKILRPSVQAANLASRLYGNESKPPKVYQTLQQILADDTESAKEIFERIDQNGDKTLSKEEFTKGLKLLGYQATPGEVALLFAALDSDDNGTIDYSEILAETNSMLTEPEATSAEKQRALEYILLARKSDANIIDYLYLQRKNDTKRLKGYNIYHSNGYNYFVAFSIYFGLCLAFFEAPSSRLGYITKDNAASFREWISVFRAISLILFAIDMTFQIWLFGIFSMDRTLKEAKKVKKTDNRGEFDVVNDRQSVFNKSLDPLVVCRSMILLFLFIDLLVPYTTGGESQDDPQSKQIVFLLPYSAIVRPFWPILRFSGLRSTLLAFGKTLGKAQAVFLLFLMTLFIFSIMGTTLLSNRHGFDVFDSFQTVIGSFLTLFVYMISAENYPDVAYPPTLCTGSDEANTREGGVISAECTDTVLHSYNMITSLVGTFLIVSLVIAVFEETFSGYNSLDRIREKTVSRMAIIAAFIVLDKDSGGSLDKAEFLDFLNGTCHTGRRFAVDDDFELSGTDFIELVEELLHEMYIVPLKDWDQVSFKPGKTFKNCTVDELFDYLYASNVPHLPPRDKIDLNKEEDIVDYWRHRGADYYQESERLKEHMDELHLDDIEGKMSALDKVRNNLRIFFDSDIYETGITAGILINSIVQCLYGVMEPENVGAIDIINIIFIYFWFVELALRIFAISFARFWHVNEDFFQMVKNRVDFGCVFASFIALNVLIISRSSEGKPIFANWEQCTSEDNCEINDWARIILSLNCLRLFGLMKSVREIIFCFYVIIPNYLNIIVLTALMMYSFAVWGCISFGGTFKYLNNYDIPQANFNSMLDSILTLFQLFVGEAWNSVMGAAIDSDSGNALLYFVAYILITTLLLTNLLMGVIISGYGNITEIQNDARKRKVEKISSKALVTALREGKIAEPKLFFEYHPHHIEIEHMDMDDEGGVEISNGRSSSAYQTKKKIQSAHADDYYNVLNDSKERYGFMTGSTLELLLVYCNLALEEVEYYNEFGWENDGGDVPKRKSRRRSVSLNGIL